MPQDNDPLRDVNQKLVQVDTSDLTEFFKRLNLLYNEVVEKKEVYKEELTFHNDVVPQIRQRIHKAQSQLAAEKAALIARGDELKKQKKEGLKKMKTDFPEADKALKNVLKAKNELNALKFSKVYRQKVEEAQITLDSRALDKFIEKLDEISKLPETSSDFCVALTVSFKHHFEAQARLFIESIRKTLATRFAAIRFPFEVAVDPESVKGELALITDYLRALHSTYSHLPAEDRINILDLIFEEFSKRFNFHFYGDKPTNDPAKPEWFFAQLSTWIAANVDFIEGYLQPLISEVSPTSAEIDVFEEFVEALVDLGARKVRTLIADEAFIADYRLLSHLIDETVMFEKELNETYMYPESSVHVISELCREDVLEAWIRIERDTTDAGVDDILSNEAAFEPRLGATLDLDDHAVPNFADAFVMLMQAMTERYHAIPDERIQIKFCQLQLHVVDEFRRRLAHIGQGVDSTPLAAPNPQLLNALWYLAQVLDDWSALPEFVRLQSFVNSSKQTDDKPIRGTFDGQSELYRHVWRQRARIWTQNFADLITYKLNHGYVSIRWSHLDAAKPVSVRPEFGCFLEEIEHHIEWLNTEISPASVMTLYHLTNHEIWNALDEAVISQTNFNYRGAAQMLFDITQGLIPLLENLYKWPKVTTSGDGTLNKKCVEILNILKLLSLPPAAAILLKEEIERVPEQMVDEKLAPFDISGLSKHRILDLFKQRCDMTLH
uniref:RAD50-interacting protein 1 n=1 Tax=Panagrellus redivivus TaxID=6233 RepID=A0A7E4VC17_PANRE